jgi:GT2 family glycosyltransferase
MVTEQDSLSGSLRIAAVVIGRNEGARLERCLRSLRGDVRPLVYVDSLSEDESVALARSLGADVVELDLATPFTAARARNEGFRRVVALDPGVDFVQFVDGDCEVAQRWIASAEDALRRNSEIGAVTGVRRERYPDHSIYNQLCDIEWRMGPFGDIDRFGGDVMIRAQALRAAGGYDGAVIAAEDDELAVRLRTGGWRILRLDRPMTIHDAAMRRLSQWWRRAMRCGYGFAQVNALHGAPPVRKFRGEIRRVWVWAAVVPIVIGLTALASPAAAALVALVYPLRVLRVAVRASRDGLRPQASLAWGLSCVASSAAELVGILKFHFDHARSRPARIIEYKGAEPR